jgi:hypothetical protein
MANTAFNGTINFNGQAAFTSADTTVAKQILASGSGASFVRSILVTSTDTVDRKLDIYYRHSSTNYLIGSIDLPAGTGTAGTNPVDALDSTHIAAGQGIPMTAGDSLQAALEATMTAAKEIDVVVLALM